MFKGHAGAVAIALAGVAVLIAAGGTAYAVTATTVNIADPHTPTRIAAVDSSGHLSTNGPTTTIDAVSFAFVDGNSAILSPTTATLAVTSINYDNSYNRIYPNTDYNVSLIRITVGAAGNCYDSDVTITRYRQDALAQAQTANQAFPFPLIIKPVGTQKYCLGVAITSTDTSHPTPYYAVTVSIGAFAVSGSYTGTGLNAVTGPATATKPSLRTTAPARR